MRHVETVKVNGTINNTVEHANIVFLLLHWRRLFTSKAIEVELLSGHTIDITDAEDDVDDDCSWSE